jgi:hypothetical protein
VTTPDLDEAAVTAAVHQRADEIRAKAADDAHADDIRILHTAGYHDAAEYLRGAR